MEGAAEVNSLGPELIPCLGDQLHRVPLWVQPLEPEQLLDVQRDFFQPRHLICVPYLRQKTLPRRPTFLKNNRVDPASAICHHHGLRRGSHPRSSGIKTGHIYCGIFNGLAPNSNNIT